MGRWGEGEMGRWGDDFYELSAFCLLPSAFCLLPSASCLLPSAGDGENKVE
ncbi:MAG: hypothetical protein F6K58_23980 [Symploca sp. SIO2E9]|nr:hypothetical protein [Symploca sp. SIO2E9]